MSTTSLRALCGLVLVWIGAPLSGCGGACQWRSVGQVRASVSAARWSLSEAATGAPLATFDPATTAWLAPRGGDDAHAAHAALSIGVPTTAVLGSAPDQAHEGAVSLECPNVATADLRRAGTYAFADFCGVQRGFAPELRLEHLHAWQFYDLSAAVGTVRVELAGDPAAAGTIRLRLDLHADALPSRDGRSALRLDLAQLTVEVEHALVTEHGSCGRSGWRPGGG